MKQVAARGVFAVSLLLAPALCAQEPVVTLRSTVTGEQQQPRVMYLVPWQQPVEGTFNYELEAGFAQELFAPVDRDEFRRDLEYQARLDDGDAAGDPMIPSTNTD
jgi:hypothetical protein